ncbi:MAG: hypothetical protein R6V59_01275 [Dehalococcoidia bacterium]
MKQSSFLGIDLSSTEAELSACLGLDDKVRLFGKTIPRKTTRQGMCFIRDKPGDILPGIKPYAGMLDYDLCDAAVAAYIALLHQQNRGDALGSSEEGLVFIFVVLRQNKLLPKGS